MSTTATTATTTIITLRLALSDAEVSCYRALLLTMFDVSMTDAVRRCAICAEKKVSLANIAFVRLFALSVEAIAACKIRLLSLPLQSGRRYRKSETQALTNWWRL